MDTMTLTLNHASVPAVLYGSPSPQVWLCLHGKGGHKEEAESFAQVVCPKGWQVLAIDLPGHGARSDRSGTAWPSGPSAWGPGSPCWPFRTAPWTEPSSSPRCWTWSA